MINKKLIEKLQEFPEDMEVLITDGMKVNCYRGEYSVEKFVDVDNVAYIDVGIGYCIQN
jgi:hypothetical protein